MDLYKYDPLRSELSKIRAMTLFPWSFESPIVVSLLTIALHEISTLYPPLDALSYAWGPLNDRFYFTVKEDGPRNIKLSITESLGEGLRHLLDSSASRTLWIDALCINQPDLDELGSQVD